MDLQRIKQIIRTELPRILQQDAEMQQFILDLAAGRFADRTQTTDRFDRLLDEMGRDREEQRRLWDEQRVRWDEQGRRWDEQGRRWDEQQRLWDEQNKRWAENQAEISSLVQSVRDLSRKHDTTIGALGARWGLHTEQSFRNAIRGILEEFPDLEVIHVIEHDDTGKVFGRPDQVELDLIIRDGLLLICEIKSSMSKADMYVFERKVRFYEERHQRQASRMLVISPMVDDRAQAVAEKLGIQVYSHSQAIDAAILGG